MAHKKTQKPKTPAPAEKAAKAPVKPKDREKKMPRKGPAGPFPAGPAQRKVAVGPANDSFEREADVVADQAVRSEPAQRISHVPASGLPATAQREIAPIAENDEKTAQKMAVQRAEKTGAQEKIPEEAEAVQRATAGKEESESDQPTVQKKSLPHGDAPDMSEIATRAVDEKDGGEPLDSGVQDTLESSLGADLDDVRVHTGAKSEEAARGLNARAFTQGRDVWLGRGESARDTRLMGHEATHVVQQTRRGQQPIAQRDSKKGSAKAASDKTEPEEEDPDVLKSKAGTIDVNTKKMLLPPIRLPGVAGKQDVDSKKLVATVPGSRKTTQRQTWLDTIKGPGVDTTVDDLLPDGKSIALEKGPRLFYLRLKNEDSFLVGDRQTIKKQARLPNWNSNGKHSNLEVDHIHEMQLGGDDHLKNYQLLDGPTNRACGNALQQEIADMIDAAIEPHVGKNKHWPKKPSAKSIRANFTEIRFENIAKGKLPVQKPTAWWTVPQIAEDGEHLKALEVLTAAKIKSRGYKLVGNSTRLLLYTSAGAGAPKEIPLKDGEAKSGLSQLRIRGFHPTSLTYEPGKGGELTGQPLKDNKIVKTKSAKPFEIREIEGQQYTARLLTDAVKDKLDLDAKGASPITLDTAYFSDTALVASGQINLTPPLFKEGVVLDIAINGDDIEISKTFTAGDFTFPGPIKVTEAALTLSAGTSGLRGEGNVDFEIDGVGTGRVTAIADASKGFAVEGQFDFDKKLFNDADATIKVRYAEEKLSGEGTLKIGKGKVRGVTSATLAVKVDGDIWSAEGVVEPDVPGVKQGSMSVRFGPKSGLEITGRLEFGEGVPRLKNGFLEAKVIKKDDAYSVEGDGAAELDIPGGSGGVKAHYRDGLFSAEASLAYEKGLAKGSINAGITNMAMGEDGKPTGEPSQDLIVYGGGSITIRFTPWLQGSAGIQIAPDGRMVITGKVELPSAIDVFSKKEIEKKLLSASIDIPIFGVSVLGQRIGIFLNIEGKLIATASIGPGQLRDVGVEITYDPEDESSAHIKGTARFVVPGEAGLKLAISGSIGAGIPVVSARAGLTVAAGLGIRGEAVAEATVEWSPATGINLDAAVSLMAEPRFTVELTGFAKIEADLLFTDIELYSETWNLAKFEYGSGLRVGAKLPVKITNGALRDLSLDDVEFIVPEIDPIDIAKDLVGRVV